METKQKNNRKLLLVLPFLVLPFLALGFYALGGGRDNTSAEQQNVKRGINIQLPDAKFTTADPLDKLSLYEVTKRDSTAIRNQFGDFVSDSATIQKNSVLGTNADPNEQRINERLAQISREIERPSQPYSPTSSVIRQPSVASGDVDRLEKLMLMMQEGKTEDPEMQQLSGMLDKIIAIQNPSLVQANNFNPVIDSVFKAIPAQIVNNQKAVERASIKLKLLDTVILAGHIIPKNHELFGTCRITNQRLLIDITNIRLGTSIIPVDLSVYSLDGMPGINAPEAELADAAGSGATDAMRSLGIYGIDQSITTQVAGAGIDAAKSLLSKKLRRVKVKLDAGRPVLIRNNKPDKH